LIQILQGSVTGLAPKHGYVLAISKSADGSGALEPLAKFMTNPAGSAIVNVSGPIRQIVTGGTPAERQWLVVADDTGDMPGAVLQVQQD
jgi:hypothetical protein